MRKNVLTFYCRTCKGALLEIASLIGRSVLGPMRTCTQMQKYMCTHLSERKRRESSPGSAQL